MSTQPLHPSFPAATRRHADRARTGAVANATTRCAASLLFAIAGLASLNPAQAQTRTPGTVCKPSGDSARAGLNSFTWAALNTSGATMDVICPVVRIKPVTVRMNVRVKSDRAIVCSIFSHESGVLKGSATVAFATSTPSLTLTALQAPAESVQTVHCSLPNNGVISHVNHDVY